MRIVTRRTPYALKLKTLAALLPAALLCAQAVAQEGQTAARPDRGVNPGGAYSVSDVENISLQNGNVNLSIPLAALPPVAGGKLSLTLRAYYNSKLWNVVREEKEAGFPVQRYVVDRPQLSDAGGWSVEGRYFVNFREAREDFDYLPPVVSISTDLPEYNRLTYNNWYKVVVRTPDGAEHELRPAGTSFQTYGGIDYPRRYLWGFHTAVPWLTNAPVRYNTTDGTYISAVCNPPGHASGIHWTLFLPDGTQIIDYNNGIQRIRDTNGNTISIFADNTGTHYRDDRAGREILVEDIAEGAGGFLQQRVWYQTTGGNRQHIDINYGATFVRGKIYGVNEWSNSVHGETGQEGGVCRRHQELPTQEVPVVREIVFPQTEPNAPARRFSFSYTSDQTETVTTQLSYFLCGFAPEPYTRTASRGMGALSRMTTPAGAQVDYTYSLAATNDFVQLDGADRLTREALAAKDLAHDGVTEHWSYDIPYDGFGTTSTVNNPDGSSSNIRYYQRHPDNPRGLGSGDLLAGQVYSVSDGLIYTQKRWAMRGVTWATGTDNFTANDPFVEAEYTSLLENGAAVKMSAKTYEHDYNGNVTKTTEYDWFDPAQVQRDPAGIPTGVPSGAKVLRVSNTTYHNPAADGSSPNYYKLRTLAAGTPSILGAARETVTGASRTRYSYDGQLFGAAPTVGNVTQVGRLDDRGDADAGNDTWVLTSTAYGAYGNPSATTDPNGNVTRYYYEDETHALPTRVEVDPLNGTGVQTTLTTYDKWTGLVTSTTDPNGQVSTIDYTNLLLGAVDPFGRPGVTRAPAGTAAGGTTLYRKTASFYEDGARRVRVESDLDAEGDGLLKSRTTGDQLGRAVFAEQNEGGPSYTISTRTVYAEAGRVILQSAPARGSAPESWTRTTRDNYGRVVETATFGGAAQPSATLPANQIVNWTGSVNTLYQANETTVTDQAGGKRRSLSDALGRLVRVDEPDKTSGALDDAGGNPVQPTSYAYDALGNLRVVEQGGQLRFFKYDSLSRMLRAKNPEQGELAPDVNFPALADAAFGNTEGRWSMGYRYDAAGNLVQRKDARGVVTTYVYDGLNRNTSVAYAGETGPPTPAVTRSYDGAAGGKGRVWKSESAQTGLTTFEEYDAAGRPLRQSQRFWAGAAWGTAYNVSYSYDISGHLKTQTYPSGHAVAYAYDNAGRLSAFTGNLGGRAVRTYADALAYDASGRMSQERFGTDAPVYNKRLYNSRGQLAEIRLGTAALPDTGWQRGAIINHYSASGWGATGGGPDNNGNLRRQDIFIPKFDAAGYDQAGNFDLSSQGFDYDALNRLRSVSEGGRWRQQYDYDRWGNRTINAAATQVFEQGATYNIPEPQFTVDTNTNRLGVPSGQSGQMLYDAAGNLTVDTYRGGKNGGGTRSYDAENRLTSSQFVAGQTQTAGFVYDADGRRVKRMVGTAAEAWQVYGADGELLAEYAPGAPQSSPQREYGYRSGELLVTAEAPAGGGAPLQRTNVAAAANGATASASTAYDPYGLTAAKAINGSRTFSGSYWNDQTQNSFPDWLQIEFAGAKTVNEIDLFFLQDNLGTAEPTEATVFTQYGVTSFEVQYWTGSAWAQVPGGAVNGNDKVWRKVTFPALTTSKIRVQVNAASDVWSRVVEVEAYEAPRNVAAAANGATATASTSYNSSLSPDKAINGSRTNGGSYWNDQTSGVSPDWLQVNFGGTKTINEVDVFSLQDNLGTTEPTEAMTFTQYGLVSFEVQYWTGSQWAAAPGAGVASNNRVWRRVTFAPLTTDRIRLVVNGATDMWSRVVEVEAYEGTAAPSAPDIRWLVADHLGTPRMVVDRTGSLAGVTRHDYLPFGEELPGDTTWRTAARGYQADGVRQKFTGYERDAEISLDYAQARYYAWDGGRFTSPDPLLASGRAALPQSWNRYSYALNNPLRLVDPTGLIDGPAPCGQQTDGLEKKIIVPQDVITGASANWGVDDDGDGRADGQLILPREGEAHLGGVAAVSYSAGHIQMIDRMNANQHGAASQLTVQQENGSGSASDSSSEKSGEVSLSAKLGLNLAASRASSSGGSSTGKTTLSQAIDPVMRCNAIALDKSATIVFSNAVTNLTGMKATVYRGDVVSQITLTRPLATLMVQRTAEDARKRGELDASVVYPVRK